MIALTQQCKRTRRSIWIHLNAPFFEHGEDSQINTSIRHDATNRGCEAKLYEIGEKGSLPLYKARGPSFLRMETKQFAIPVYSPDVEIARRVLVISRG